MTERMKDWAFTIVTGFVVYSIVIANVYSIKFLLGVEIPRSIMEWVLELLFTLLCSLGIFSIFYWWRWGRKTP